MLPPKPTAAAVAAVTASKQAVKAADVAAANVLTATTPLNNAVLNALPQQTQETVRQVAKAAVVEQVKNIVEQGYNEDIRILINNLGPEATKEVLANGAVGNAIANNVAAAITEQVAATGQVTNQTEQVANQAAEGYLTRGARYLWQGIKGIGAAIGVGAAGAATLAATNPAAFQAATNAATNYITTATGQFFGNATAPNMTLAEQVFNNPPNTTYNPYYYGYQNQFDEFGNMMVGGRKRRYNY